ncbi:hypothetical protein EOD39_10772 [Acipenser ruthenus]|uniref:PiggyBac transposable element-derived protein domain-containing protein n=1 Tax=Acipenser ruthenus TaxID=7906 RepID=A0A444TX28_ACIRT|nr:hypothetical protein EOD39_10772 [Acipenser ruthenus]
MHFICSTPKKRQRKGKRTLVAVSQRHPETARDSAWTLSTLIPAPSHGQRMWKKADTPMFQVPDPVFDVPDSVKSPYQFFKMLFTDQMTEHITEQTSLYSAQELASSINTNPVADVVPVKRFRLLSMSIHFNNNTQYNNSLGCFFKIRPVFDMLHQQCLLIPPTYKQSVDEVMVAYKGTRAGNLWQYTANKPDKWGYKLFCQRDCDLLKENPKPLKRLRLSVAQTVKLVNEAPARVGRPSISPKLRKPEKKCHQNPRATKPTPDVRYDNYGHWPVFGDQRGRCNLCPKGVPRWRCSKCGDGKLFQKKK